MNWFKIKEQEEPKYPPMYTVKDRVAYDMLVENKKWKCWYCKRINKNDVDCSCGVSYETRTKKEEKKENKNIEIVWRF